MTTHLEVFDLKLGTEAKPLLLPGSDQLGLVADKMLSAVQTVVDVLTEGDKSYTVTFEPTMTAYTVHETGRISISGLPLMKAKVGTPLSEIAAVMTGFAVHEVGHTKVGGKHGIIDAVRKEWPSKQLPATLANIVEDVVLEKWTVERYAGFADTGSGESIFAPTYRWLQDMFPAPPLTWRGSSGEKVNVVGQIARYRDTSVFTDDAETQDQLRWFTDWEQRITARTTPKQGVELVREALLRIHNSPDAPDEPPIEDEGGDEDGGTEPSDTEGGTKSGGEVEIPELPNEEDDDDDDDDGDGDGEAEDGDDDTEGEDADDADGEAEDGESGDGEGNGEGTDNSGDSDGEAESFEGDVNDRPEMERGSIDGASGAGGSGGAHAEVGDELPADVDEGFDLADVQKGLDEVSKADPVLNDTINQAVQEERRSLRLEAGIYGKMKVVFK